MYGIKNVNFLLLSMRITALELFAGNEHFILLYLVNMTLNHRHMATLIFSVLFSVVVVKIIFVKITIGIGCRFINIIVVYMIYL